MNGKIKMKFDRCSFMKLFGFLAPAPIISIFSITTYVWFLLITALGIIIYSVRKKFKYIKKLENTYLYYAIVVYLSALLCILRMPETWKADSITFLIQFSATFLIYIFFTGYKEVKVIISFVQGIYLSAVIQMIWGYMQLLLYKMGIDLNTIVFGKILHMYPGVATHYSEYGGIKVSAFCWNAGNFAPLMIIGYVLSKKPYVKIAFILISLLSGSRTLMLGMLFCITIKVLIGIYEKKKVSRTLMLIIGAGAIAVVVVFILKAKIIIPRIARSIAVLNVFNNFYTEGSTNTHILYLLRIFDVTKKNDILSNLIGYGPNCSGYAFVKHYRFYTDIGKWSMECDYVNILWNYGYLGFITYYTWLVKNMRKCVKILNENSYIILFLTLMIMGLMYNVTFNWVNLLFIFIFILCNRGINIFDIENETEKKVYDICDNYSNI